MPIGPLWAIGLYAYSIKAVGGGYTALDMDPLYQRRRGYRFFFFGGGGGSDPPPPLRTAVCNIFFIFKPTDVNFPLPFKFYCRIQST